MSKLSTSHQAQSQRRQRYLDRKIAQGKAMTDPNITAMTDLFDSMDQQKADRESDPEWQANNLEWDLRTTDWILAKAQSSSTYAQNIYASLCNNQFQKQEVWPLLQGKQWSCSWRYAGGIVADMLERGDYMDWYCSGIRDTDIVAAQGYVGEGEVTEQIREDLKRLGWCVVEDK
jgi:hypothetical protein